MHTAFFMPLKSIFFIFSLLYVDIATAAQKASDFPDRIVLSPSKDPSTSVTVTWRTQIKVATSIAQIAPLTDAARFDLAATSYKAKSSLYNPAKSSDQTGTFSYPVNASSELVRYHTVVFNHLSPDTQYVYRVRGALGHWSQWTRFKTAHSDQKSTEFLYFGDAQHGMASHWPVVLKRGVQASPEANFALFAGDMVDNGASEQEWSEWFSAAPEIYASVPVVPVIGNHEYDTRVYSSRPLTTSWQLSQLYQHQFNLPIEPELPAALAETAFTLSYPHVDVFVFNSEARHHPVRYREQVTWLKNALSNSKARWKIVALHHPLFSSCGMPLNTPGQDEPLVRNALLPLLKTYQVDLVLQAHDHNYSRGSIGVGHDVDLYAKTGLEKKVQTVFVTASSSAKAYPHKTTGWQQYQKYAVTLDRIGENTPTFQIIKVNSNQLSYQSISQTGRIYDEFALVKQADRNNNLLKVSANLPSTRRFSNSEAYRPHYDLY